MSLIAVAPTTDASIEVPNIPFFPTLTVGEVREAIRVDGTVTPQRFRSELIAAMFSVNRELEQFRFDQQLLGIIRLQDIPADSVDGQHRLVHLYKRAVCYTLKAVLLEIYQDIDTARSSGAAQKEKDLSAEIDSARRDVRWAIRDLLGIKRATVELL